MVHLDFREYAQDNSDEKKKRKLPPLLKKLTEVHSPEIDYLGVSFGLTQELYKFWNKNNFSPAYLSLRKNDVTGEYTCIVLKSLKESLTFTEAFSNDFRRRFINLLSYDFRDLEPYMCIDILKANVTNCEEELEIGKESLISKEELKE